MTRHTCTRCLGDNHEACDGGTWDDWFKPTLCECFMTRHEIGKQPMCPACDGTPTSDPCPVCEAKA